MVTSPGYLNKTTSGDTGRAPFKNTQKPEPDKRLYYKPDTEPGWDNEIGNQVTITLDEAARLLNISSTTVKLWSDMGVLHTGLSSNKHLTVKRADILTFLPVKNTLLPAVIRTNNNPLGSRLESLERKKLAEINVQAIIELTKQSVSEIDHLGSTTYSSRRVKIAAIR